MTNLNREENPDNLTTVLRSVLHQWTKQHLHTCRPGLIEVFDPETRRARIRAALRIVLTGAEPGVDGEAMEPSISVDVPVVFPAGGGHVLMFPLSEGDPVLLLFSERGLTQFKETLELSNPDKARFFNESDAIALAGFGPLMLTPASMSGAALQTEDAQSFVEVSPDQVKVKHGDQEITVADAGLVGSIEGDVNLTASGNVTLEANQVNIGGGSGRRVMDDRMINLFNTHTHPSSGSPPTQRATAALHATDKTRAE